MPVSEHTPAGNRGVLTDRPRDWPAMLAGAIAGDVITAVFQPIVDLARATVVGYEALARFSDPRETDPEEWFRAARSHGCSGELGAATMTAAFAHRASLPRSCFLAVNVEPDVLSQQAVRNVFDRQDDLAGVVIELTEQTRIESYLALEPYLERYKAAGALIAVDDAGSGYAGLQHLINLRPAIIKLDRQFVAGIDYDEAKRALVEMLGIFASRTDCWLLAEGIERSEELDVLAYLGVPLVQGYLLGRPALPWSDIEPGPAERLRGRIATQSSNTLRDLIETNPSATDVEQASAILSAYAQLDHVVMLDRNQRPTGIADLESLAVGMTSLALQVNVDTPLTDAARRAIVRPRHSRFQPLVCTDNAGRYAGIVRLERLIDKLAALSQHTAPVPAGIVVSEHP